MHFKTATDRLLQAIRLPDVAHALGVTPTAVARWRVDPEKDSSREPRVEWQLAVAELAEARGRDLLELAKELRAHTRS
jgi:hypothetical protein